MSSAFVLPMLALQALTLLVWGLAVRNRVREIRDRRIPLQSLAKARDVAVAFQDCQAMDNFNNLMQLPVLFYVLCLLLQQEGEGGLLFVMGAWTFVALRVVHSAIQVTSNRVRHRFYAWLASNVVLFGLWAGAGAHWLFV